MDDREEGVTEGEVPSEHVLPERGVVSNEIGESFQFPITPQDDMDVEERGTTSDDEIREKLSEEREVEEEDLPQADLGNDASQSESDDLPHTDLEDDENYEVMVDEVEHGDPEMDGEVLANTGSNQVHPSGEDEGKITQSDDVDGSIVENSQATAHKPNKILQLPISRIKQ